MDTTLKWAVTRCNNDIGYPDGTSKVEELCRKGWEPFAVDGGSILLKRPCGELPITKHPEIFQRAGTVEY